MTPSQEALKLADALARQVGGLTEWPNSLKHIVADVIDRELHLPQRNVALLLAQGFCDDCAKYPQLKPDNDYLLDSIDQLRDALAAIKK